MNLIRLMNKVGMWESGKEGDRWTDKWRCWLCCLMVWQVVFGGLKSHTPWAHIFSSLTITTRNSSLPQSHRPQILPSCSKAALESTRKHLLVNSIPHNFTFIVLFYVYVMFLFPQTKLCGRGDNVCFVHMFLQQLAQQLAHGGLSTHNFYIKFLHNFYIILCKNYVLTAPMAMPCSILEGQASAVMGFGVKM